MVLTNLASIDANWSFMDDEANLSQNRLSQRSRSADRVRGKSMTSSEADACGEDVWVPFLRQDAPWWAHVLRRLTSNVEIPSCSRPLRCMSCCTGLCAEAFALEAGLSLLLSWGVVSDGLRL